MHKQLYTSFFSMWVLTISFLMTLPVISAGQTLYSNTFTGASACPTNGNVPANGPNATGTPVTRSTITCMNTANVFNSTTLNNTASIDDNSYIQFSVTADPGATLNLTSLDFRRQASNSAPNKLEVRYSTDGFVTSTSWGIAPLSTPTSITATTTWDFADFSTSLGGTVTFRFYPYSTQRADLTAPAASASGTFRVDDVVLNGNAPLPVDLVSFSGKSGNKEVLLNWVTAWERQNEGFNIQKSTNGRSFESIGFVPGNTTTQLQSVYEFRDADVMPGTLYYYRLKQNDIGGGFALSQIIAVRANAGELESESLVSPNPSRGSFTLSGQRAEAATVKLYTAVGVEIPIRTLQTGNSKTLDITTTPGLAPGLYYLKVNAVDGSTPKMLKVLIH